MRDKVTRRLLRRCRKSEAWARTKGTLGTHPQVQKSGTRDRSPSGLASGTDSLTGRVENTGQKPMTTSTAMLANSRNSKPTSSPAAEAFRLKAPDSSSRFMIAKRDQPHRVSRDSARDTRAKHRDLRLDLWRVARWREPCALLTTCRVLTDQRNKYRKPDC